MSGLEVIRRISWLQLTRRQALFDASYGPTRTLRMKTMAEFQAVSHAYGRVGSRTLAVRQVDPLIGII